MSTNKLSSYRILIIGLGSIGHRHLKNIRMICPNSYIIVWRQHFVDRDRELSLADCYIYSSEEAINTNPHIVVLTNPASFHVKTALLFVKPGVHFFIEKPLSHNLDGIDELLRICHKNNSVLMVGYNLRFSITLKIVKALVEKEAIGTVKYIRAEVGQYLPDWRPLQDYQYTVSARRELGGGVLLELSHEIDYICWLLGKVQTVYARLDKLSDLEIDVEDSAEIILSFQNGAVGSVHLDMIQRIPSRLCRIVGTKGTIVWDGVTNYVAVSSNLKEWDVLHPASEINHNQIYIDEFLHFLDCIEKHKHPIVTGEDGKYVLEIVEAARNSYNNKKVINL